MPRFSFLLLNFVFILVPLAAQAASPNVLMIAVDDMRPQLGCYGDATIKSPQLDRFASGGTVFERAYCQQALCSPSRISLLSGRYPSTTRIFAIGPTLRSTMPNITTLPQHFKNNGYHTRSLGKVYHVGIDDEASWSEPSWQSSAPRQGPEAAAKVKAARAKGNAPAKGKGAPQYAAPPYDAPDLADEALLDGATAAEAVGVLQSLAKKPEQPFFLAVGFANPHVPWVAPKKYWDLYDREKLPLATNEYPPKSAPKFAATTGADFRWYAGVPAEGSESEEFKRACLHGYLAAISYIDAQIGRLLATLEETGLAKNTVVVVWGDHGYYMGQHGWWGGKHNNYEGATRVPLLIRAPEFSPGKTAALVEFVDLAPTLVDLCGLPAEKGFEGRSLKPLLADSAASVKEAAYSWYPKGGNMGRAMRTDRWRYVEWRGKDNNIVATELYDHEADPEENQNLADDPAHAATVKELAAKMKRR